MYSYEERSSLAFGLSSSPSAFGSAAHLALGLPEQSVNSAGERTEVDTRDLIILIIGPPKHHTNNESNHQHRRLGHDLRRRRLGSGTPWRSGCKYMLNLLSHQPLAFSKPNKPSLHFRLLLLIPVARN